MPTKHLGGQDSLYSIAQMPGGVPVATMAIGGARNAGLLAVRILAVTDPALTERLIDHQSKLELYSLDQDANLPDRPARPNPRAGDDPEPPMSTIPNVLASRYASAEMADLWSPEHKIVLERELWIAVMRAQRDLGVDVPDDAVDAYEAVVDKVDLDSIEARERVTRHDVKARIEEFSALAGHEHVHKGMTSRDLTENVEQLQVRRSLELVRDRCVAALVRLAAAGGRARDHRDRRPQPQRRRPGDDARQAVRERRRGAAGRSAALEELLARYPLRGIKGPVGTQQDQLDLLDGDDAAHGRARGRGRRATSGSRTRSTNVGQVYPRSLDLDVVSALVQLGVRAVVARHHDPADGRQRAGHRGVPAGPGRLVGHAAQDEHPHLRAHQRLPA